MGQRSCSFPQPEEFGFKHQKSTLISRLQCLYLYLLYSLFVQMWNIPLGRNWNVGLINEVGFKDYLIFIPASLSESKSPASSVNALTSIFNIVIYMSLYTYNTFIYVYTVRTNSHTHANINMNINVNIKAQFHQCHHLSWLGILNPCNWDSNVSRD